MPIRKVKKSRKFRLTFFIVLSFLLFVSVMINAEVKETVVKIAHEANYSYFMPDLKFSPSGAIYIVYEARNLAAQRSDIYLSKYENEKVTFVANVSESTTRSYWPDIDILKDGSIHIIYADQRGTTVTIKYRSFAGNTWSNIVSLGSLSGLTMVEDVRFDVDEDGNFAGALTQFFNPVTIRIFSKYGNNISFGTFPFTGGRTKHADIIIDKDFVHMIWQYTISGTNIIAYAKRTNQHGSNWQSWIDVKAAGCQRPRISQGEDIIPQVLLAKKDETSRRKIYYKKWNADLNKFDGVTEVSPLDRMESNNFSDIAAVNLDNVMTTMQQGNSGKGKNISYNWKQNGKWTGNKIFQKTTQFMPTRQSVVLKSDSLFSAIAFVDRESGVYLLLAEEEGEKSEPPVAAFSYTPQSGSAPLEVSFDASASNDPDGQIVSYKWNFGDGFSGEGQTITHIYTVPGIYEVKLTVYDNTNNSDEDTGSVEVVAIQPPLNVNYEITQQRGFLIWTYLGKVTWEANPLNVANGINIVKYNIYRKSSIETAFSLYDSVAAAETYLYYDQLGQTKFDYQYTVTSVDDLGRESNPSQVESPSSILMTPKSFDKQKEK